MDLTQVKEKVRKLLNVAKNDASQGAEIANALTAARHLMQAYQLEESEIHDNQTEDVWEFMEQSYTWPAQTKVAWIQQLAWFCCDFVGGVKFYNTKSQRLQNGHMKWGAEIVFYGVDEEVALAYEMMDSLTITIIALSVAFHGTWARKDGAAYAQGFVQGLRTQMDKIDAITKQTSTGTDLIVKTNELVAAKRNAAKNWLSSEKGIKLRKSSGLKGTWKPDAQNQGREHGRKFDLDNLGKRKVRISR